MRMGKRRLLAILLIVALIGAVCPEQILKVQAQTDTGKTYTFTSDSGEVKISLKEMKDNDNWYEYYLTVSNVSSQSVCDWSIVLNCSDVSSYSKAFECSATADQSAGTLTVKGAGNKKVVAAGSSVSSGESFKLGFGSSVTFTGGTITYSYGTQSSQEDSADGVGHGNTYLADYTCKYNLTGEAKTMASTDTPFGKHGKLHVEGTKLTDEHGQSVILRGASTHGMHWGEMTPFVNQAAFQNLRDEWGVDMVRLVSYVTQGGYTEGSQATLDTCIQNGVSYADKLGMYAIIDWHIHNEDPNTKKSEAITFFNTYSKKYADHDNIIYEICNEPTGTPWAQIKPYAQEIVNTIRANDPDAIIVVGTNNWSQDVDEVATGGGKIDDPNVMYTIHFYSGTHSQSLRDKVTAALNAGTPVFCTEFGICDASGNGGFNLDEADRWIDYFEEKGISYCCWSLCNKDESASMISPQCSQKSGWVNTDLGATGAWLVNTYRSRRQEEPDVTAAPKPTAGATEKPETSATPVINPTLSPVTSATPVINPTATPSSGSVSGGSENGDDATPQETPQLPGEAAGGSDSAQEVTATDDNVAINTNAAIINQGIRAVWSGKKIQVKWSRVRNASGYEIYISQCGAQNTRQNLAGTVKGNNKSSFAVAKMNGKSLNSSGVYEVMIKAYRFLPDGKKVYVAKSLVLHVAGNTNKKYTNVKKVKPSVRTLTLKKGKSKKLKVKLTAQSKKKKLLVVKHTKSLRYLTTNKKVAVVDSKGRVKAAGKGSCVIYVIALNGVSGKIKVKVK